MEGDAHWVLFDSLTAEQMARLRAVLERKRIREAEEALRRALEDGAKAA
jgi:hypothetical protein